MKAAATRETNVKNLEILNLTRGKDKCLDLKDISNLDTKPSRQLNMS